MYRFNPYLRQRAIEKKIKETLELGEFNIPSVKTISKDDVEGIVIKMNRMGREEFSLFYEKFFDEGERGAEWVLNYLFVFRKRDQLYHGEDYRNSLLRPISMLADKTVIF